MFNRNPHVLEPMNICVEGECSMFAEIFEATKKVSEAMEEEKTSDCQVNVVYPNFTSKKVDDKKGEKAWSVKYELLK